MSALNSLYGDLSSAKSLSIPSFFSSAEAQKAEEMGPQLPEKETRFDLGEFESLLNRLEASKGRQLRQKATEGRKDIFSKGLASMMSNF